MFYNFVTSQTFSVHMLRHCQTFIIDSFAKIIMAKMLNHKNWINLKGHRENFWVKVENCFGLTSANSNIWMVTFWVKNKSKRDKN